MRNPSQRGRGMRYRFPWRRFVVTQGRVGAMPLSHVAVGVLVVAIWGTNFVVIHEGLKRFPPFTLATMRFALASVPFLGLVPRPSMQWHRIVSYGLLIGVGQFGLMLYAMQGHVSPGLASLLIQAQAFFTILLALVLDGERIRTGTVVALGISVFGVLFIALRAGGAADLFGIVLVLGAALGWAGGNIVAKRAGKVDMFALMVWSGAAAVPPLLAAALWFEGPQLIVSSLQRADLVGWLTLPWQSFANSLFGYSVWNWLLARHRASDVAPLGLLVPVFGMSASAVWLGEPMPAWKVEAAGLVLAGLAINMFASRRAAKVVAQSA